jgi:hypothetical protein
MSSAGIPIRVRVRARLLWFVSKPRWRTFWVRYWESQGVSEEQQMAWAAEERETEG